MCNTKADFQHRIQKLRKAVRRRAWIDENSTLVRIKDMDNSMLLRTYRAALRYYRGTQAKGQKALEAISKLWSHAPEIAEYGDINTTECCFEHEADYVLEWMELSRRYARALHDEVARRKLEPVFDQMSRPFGRAKRGWNARQTTTA